MGHMRLGKIPKSKKWDKVVATVVGGSSSAPLSLLPEEIDHLSQQTLEAAEIGLLRAIDDAGLRYSFFLLTQLALAARADDWKQRFHRLGINLSHDSTLFDIVADVQYNIDDYVVDHAIRTDVSEMAQQAVGDALTAFSPQTCNLFGASDEDVRNVVQHLSTKAGFAQLGQTFFGKFMSRFLNFYLSRVTSGAVGGTTLPQLGDQSHFNDDLQRHCLQSAKIVADFCGEWYSKTNFQTGITFENTSRFMAVALKKLEAELKQQRAES